MLFDFLEFLVGGVSLLLAKLSSWQVSAAEQEIKIHKRKINDIRHHIMLKEQEMIREQNEIDYLQNFLDGEYTEV